MKEFVKEYVKIIINVACAILFGLGFYNILINVFHQNYIDQTLVVGNLHSDYNAFHDNIVEIEKNLKRYNFDENKFSYDITTMETLRGKISYCMTFLKNEKGLYGVGTNTPIKTYDLYSINHYFVQSVVDECWTLGMSFINHSDKEYDGYFGEMFPRYTKSIAGLVENSKYVRGELLSNSRYHYGTDVSRSTIRNDMLAQYDFIVRNYLDFSDIILEVSEYLVVGDNNG